MFSRLERLGYYATIAVLGTVFSLAVLVGLSILAGLVTSRLFVENALLFQKFAAVAGGAAVLGFIGAALVLGGKLLRRLILRIRQARSDRAAARILQALHSDPDARVPDFVVYLRAFETTRHLGIPLYLQLQKLLGMANLTVNDVENYVSQAVARLGPLVALGRPGEAFGAGRIITTDQEWKQDIMLLLRRCRAILLIPSHREGTLWEIESIYRGGLLEKCILLMPPYSRKAADTSERWCHAQKAAATLGLELPDYQKSGMLFTLNGTGKVSAVEPLILGRTRPLRKAIKRLLKAKKTMGLFAAVAKADRRRRRARVIGWASAVQSVSPLFLAVLNLFLPPLPQPTREESWELTFDRLSSYKKMSDYDTAESILLYKSGKYRTWSATIPSEQIENARVAVMIKGLFRLDDTLLRQYYIALGDMLDRTDPDTCADFTTGKGNSRAADVLSYIPPEEIDAFLRARTEAVLAEVEERPFPVIDTNGTRAAFQPFMSLFTAPERDRWMQIGAVPGAPSATDTCWITLKMYQGVKNLPTRDSANWARWITATMVNNLEEQQAKATRAQR